MWYEDLWSNNIWVTLQYWCLDPTCMQKCAHPLWRRAQEILEVAGLVLELLGCWSLAKLQCGWGSLPPTDHQWEIGWHFVGWRLERHGVCNYWRPRISCIWLWPTEPQLRWSSHGWSPQEVSPARPKSPQPSTSPHSKTFLEPLKWVQWSHLKHNHVSPPSLQVSHAQSASV